jgi:hypothetical protein
MIGLSTSMVMSVTIDDALSAMELLGRMGRSNLANRTAREVQAYRFERSRVYLSEKRFKDDAYWRASQGKHFLPQQS